MTATAQVVAARVRAYSDAFGAAFHAKDAALLRPYCHVPAFTLGGGRMHVITTEAESDARWTRALSALPADYNHSVLHTVDVTLTSDSNAFASVDCSRYRANGDELVRFFASYLLVCVGGDWRVCAWIPHAPGQSAERVRVPLPEA